MEKCKPDYNTNFYILPHGGMLHDHINVPYDSLQKAKDAAKIAVIRLNVPVFIFELNLASIVTMKEPEIEYEDYGKYKN